VAAARSLATSCLESSGLAGAGVGNPCDRPADVARSYAEARRALAAGQRMGGPASVSVFADLGIHRLLLRVPDVGDLRAFAEEVLGGLSGEYLETLEVYFLENRSPARAAQRLNVHPNTVGYRIRRVEELTGLSFARHRDRLMAEVAVEILRALGDRP
jgi:DNA-binding PucR family transcriptional regulator